MEEKEENKVNTEEIKKETVETAKQVKDSIKNVDIKNDAKEATGFVSAMFKDPFAKIKEIFSQGNTSNIVTTGLIGLILFCGIKLFKKEEPETVVGLAQSLKEREINLYKDLSMRRQVAGPMSLERPASTLPIQNTQPIVN